MAEIVRICDYERREGTILHPNDPSAVIIILPTVRIERFDPPRKKSVPR